MGFPAGSTSGCAVSQIDRLRALGDSWDVHTSLMLNRFSRYATIRVDGPLLVHSPSKQFSGNSAKQALLAPRATGGPDAIVQLLAALTKDEQLMLLQHMRAPTSPVFYAGSVLDSGSSKHLHTQVQVTHSEDRCSISGFKSNKDPTWTQCNGHLPLTACDTVTGQDRPFDVWDSDKLNTVALGILSLGKLVRSGWSFYFESSDKLVAVTPDSSLASGWNLGMMASFAFLMRCVRGSRLLLYQQYCNRTLIDSAHRSFMLSESLKG